MKIRVLDLDGSVAAQRLLLERFEPAVVDLRSWGPRLRLGCTFGRFRRFEKALAAAGRDPALTLLGSGDFHHITLALLRRIREPFNLLVLDNHPDWMRGVPILHCGTWLYHAARLPAVRHIFHVGGDVDFDNRFRWLAPWRQLRSGKIRVIPAVRRYEAGRWADLDCPPLRETPRQPFGRERIERLIEPWAADLARYPLYVSLDKDVMTAQEAVVNWDSGHLTLPELESVVAAFVAAAGGDLAGVDVVGDWSRVRLRGLLRRLLHWTEHPRLSVVPLMATWRNQQTNLAVLGGLLETLGAANRVGEAGKLALAG